MGIAGPAPAHLGRYELVARLASGGMGEIFLARLEGAAGFEKLCVIKRILPHLADDPRFRAMLIAEARIASMMTHANICQVHELGETDGQLYIVMEYLEGVTILPLLRKLSKEGGALDLGFVGGVIQQAADGLHYAHELKDRSGEYLGIVHRDVTPSNVFVTESGVVKVLDFGIAKVKDASAHTQTGTVKGKYAYMSPEQLRGGAIDRRADVFALGVVMYEMLALRRLFQRKTDYLTFRAVMEQPIMDVRHYRADCPDALAAVLARALDRDPANRFQTARQLGAAVTDAIAAIRRPWTQGGISDFVATSFAAEIEKRSGRVAGAMDATRQGIPTIVEPDEGLEGEDGTDDEFPAVDSAVSGTPPQGRHVIGASGEHPFNVPITTGPEIEALREVQNVVTEAQPIVVVQPRRSVVWPVVAFAMVAIAGGALFLVWRQMQNPQQTLVITNEGNGRVTQRGPNTLVVESNPDQPPEPVTAPPTEPVTAPPTEPATKARVERTVSSQPARVVTDPFEVAVGHKRDEISRCADVHGNLPPGTLLVLVIGPDGHAKSIGFDPDTVDATPLGACIKGVLEATMFPRGDRERGLKVRLRRPV